MPVTDPRAAGVVPTPDQLKRFFGTHNTAFEKCLEPAMKCDQSAIRAHSIQNAQVLDLLAVDGHVIMPRAAFSKAGPRIELASIGRNLASTFAGLCGQHDAAIFAPIDTKPFDITDPEQLFLIAYRSVTRELHAVMAGAMKIQSNYSSRIRDGLDSGNEPTPAGIEATQHLLKAFFVWRYRAEHFDKRLVTEDYAGITHRSFVLEGQKPAIALSSLFHHDEVQAEGNEFAGIVLNVFPVDVDRTAVVFSFASPHQGQATAALDRILSSSGDYQKYELSKLILEHIENFAISPRHFETWPSAKREAIERAFARTIFKDVDAVDGPELMLF